VGPEKKNEHLAGQGQSLQAHKAGKFSKLDMQKDKSAKHQSGGSDYGSDGSYLTHLDSKNFAKKNVHTAG